MPPTAPASPSTRTRVKICGVTDAATAHTAAAAGADAIGLIFHPPSACHLELAQAAAIAAAVHPFVATVAVLVNPTAEQVRVMIERVKPSCLQFHGEEPPEFCAAFATPYIKALRVADDDGDADRDLAAQAVRYAAAGARGVLLDTHRDGQYGGTGATFDWARANDVGGLPLILAGGLTADNVADAVARVAPFAVDVRTGVETAGRKDADKIRRFCRAVAAANLATVQ